MTAYDGHGNLGHKAEALMLNMVMAATIQHQRLGHAELQHEDGKCSIAPRHESDCGLFVEGLTMP